MKRYLTFLIISLFIFISIAFFQPLYFSGEYKKYSDPRLSVQDITITTPANITYTSPMSGYYPATYGFENDIVSALPQGLSSEVGSGTIIEVIDQLDGHNMITRLYDGASGTPNYANLSHTFSPKSSGVIEFWFRRSGVTEVVFIELWNETLYGLSIYSEDRGSGLAFEYYNGTDYIPIMSHNSDQWYHHRIDFNCTSGTFDWYIDGVLRGDDLLLREPTPFFVRFTIRTRGSGSTGYNVYIDGLGMSWDTNYNIGENLNEGLLLNFENNTALDWIGYSLDKQTNRTILGNSTIPMPDYGEHNIQVFGNDTFGTYHQSDLVYFSYALFRINSPENITYTSPMSGYYPATYGFEDDIDGTRGTDIDFLDVDGSVAPLCENSIIASLDGHNKVLELDDQNTTGNINLIHNFPSAQPFGTVEFWIRTNDATEYLAINFRYDIGINVFSYRIAFDFHRIWDGSYKDLITFADDTWYHVRLDWECTPGGYQGLSQYYFRFYLNNVSQGDYTFGVNQASISSVSMYTNNAATSIKYLDAWGESWDPNYNIGDNLEEGLLLSFENYAVLDWAGYSLDGQPNKTILGNVTIPLPVNGIHTIQVFGDTLLGPILETELIFFTINTSSETVPPPPTTFFDTTVVIITTIIIIGVVGSLSFGLIYLKKVRHKGLKIKPKDTRKAQEKKLKAQLFLERERLKRERIENERLEREMLERERLIRQENLAREEERKTLEKLKKIMSVSSRISMEMVREYLKIDKRAFNVKVIDWANQFGFTIDGDYLNIRKENVSDFIDELEKQFSQWRKDEQGRESKI